MILWPVSSVLRQLSLGLPGTFCLQISSDFTPEIAICSRHFSPNFTNLKNACYKCVFYGDIALEITNDIRQHLEIMHEHQFATNGVPINALADSRPG